MVPSLVPRDAVRVPLLELEARPAVLERKPAPLRDGVRSEAGVVGPEGQGIEYFRFQADRSERGLTGCRNTRSRPRRPS